MMFKLIVAVAIVGMAVVEAAPASRKSDLESAIFFKGERVEPEEMLKMVDELVAIYEQEGAPKSFNDNWMRKVAQLLQKTAHLQLNECARRPIYHDQLYSLLSYQTALNVSAGPFVELYSPKQEELCDGAVYPRSRQVDLEWEIFASGEDKYVSPIEPTKMMEAVQELKKIYEEQGDAKDQGPYDVTERKMVDILYKIGDVLQENCANLTDYKELPSGLYRYHVILKSADEFVPHYMEKQEKLCQ